MQKEVWKLMSIRMLRSFMIIMPIIGLYFLEHGLSMQDIFVLQVVFSVAMIVLELPSGHFADRVGRKHALVVGSIFGAIGFFVYGTVDSFGGFLVAELLLAASVGFISGADSAFLYDTLQQHGAEKKYLSHEGRMFGLQTMAEAVASVLGGVLAAYVALENLFFAEGVLMVGAVIIALSLKEPTREKETKRVSMLGALRFSTRENVRLRQLNIFSGAVGASTLAMVWFAQPYWEGQHINVAYFGMMWAGLLTLTALASLTAPRIEKYLRFRTLFGIIGLAPLVLYGLLGIFAGSIVALLIIPLFWVLRGIHAPLVRDYVNRETTSGMRATVLSINQLYSRLFFSVLSPFVGWVADVWSFQAAFFASALTFGILAFLGFLFWYAAVQKTAKQTVAL